MPSHAGPKYSLTDHLTRPFSARRSGSYRRWPYSRSASKGFCPPPDRPQAPNDCPLQKQCAYIYNQARIRRERRPCACDSLGNMMENRDVAKILLETAQLLEIDGAMIGRYRSYEKVAELLFGMPERIEDIAKDPEKLRELPGA